MSLSKRPITGCRRISQVSQSPPCSPIFSPEPVRMSSVSVQSQTLAADIPVSIKQIDLDGYDIMPPVPTYHSMFSLPGSLAPYDHNELRSDIASAIESQYRFPCRKSDAKRDFKFKLLVHFKMEQDEKCKEIRITESNWDGVRSALLGGEWAVVGFEVLWWKKTADQKKADRALEKNALACCILQ